MVPGTVKKLMTRVAVLCGGLLLFTNAAVAQVESATITVVPESSTVRVQVSGVPRKSWSFPDAYAGVVGLGRRVRKFQAPDTPGARNSVRELAPGHYEFGASVATVTYEVDLTPPPRASDAAFVSWLNREHGILQLNDLLPVTVKQPGSPIKPVFTTVEAPEGWSAYVNEEVAAMRALGFAGADDGVILVGKNLRRSVRTISGNSFKLLIDGAWPFSDQEAMDTFLKVIQLHSDIGAPPCAHVTLVLSTFPSGAAAANNWSAETRGCNVTLLMGETPSRVGALAQLGNALTHETFHLWIPNGVALSGDYDWFYEGFTMYQAARAAVRLGLVTWPEFLNAIARAYDGSMGSSATQSLSLIQASKQRWTIGSQFVYSKAMVVAFVYDLNLRNQTAGKRSLDDVYRRVLRENPRSSAVKKVPADGNTASTAALRSELSSQNFVERFITAPVSINLNNELAPFGLRVEKIVRTHISVSDALSKRQSDLLKQLGYNEPRARKR
jgi:hypothetical protein